MKNFFFIISLLTVNNIYAQNKIDTLSYKKNWFVSSSIGIQLSGIKSEDFVKSNYSPLIDLSLGKYFTSKLALQFGYNGWYFNTISNPDKRHYAFLYGKVIFNINKIINDSKNYRWFFNLNLGSGYFYNYYYNRPNICGILGLSLHYNLSEQTSLFISTAAIMGWDIYQNNEDILPGLKLGSIIRI